MKKIKDLDKLPVKESIRREHHKEKHCMKIYDQGKCNYKIVSRYIDRCLMKSIGRNYDKVKKHICERMCYNKITRYKHNLVDSLISRYIGEGNKYKYTIDSQGRVQLSIKYAERKRRWVEYNRKKDEEDKNII